MSNMNLFSSFDPMVLNFPLNWLSSLLFMMFFMNSYWLVKNESSWMFKWFMNMMFKDFKNLMFNSKLLMLMSLFLFIFFINFLGLFPYIFTSSTHLIFGLSLGLPLWAGYMSLSFVNQTEFMLAHLMPMGTPLILQPFMVLIELISNIIRPLTLSIRLMANMMAGHLLLTLLGMLSNQGMGVLFMVILGMIMILLLELGVALIQAYVFTLLSGLYISEMDTIKMSQL